MHATVRRVLFVCLLLVQAACLAASEEQSTVDLPRIEPLELIYKARDPQEQPIEERAMLEQLQRAAALATRYQLQTTRSATSTSWVDVTGSQVTMDWVERALVIRYGAQSRYIKDGTLTGSVLNIKVAYQVDRSDALVRIKFTFPTSATLTYKRLLLPARKLWSMQEVTEDYGRIVTALKRAELRLVTTIHGELSSSYKPDAIAGNLERILGRPVPYPEALTRTAGQAVRRDNVYTVTLGKNRQSLSVSIYPYRDGTKLTYLAEMPFTLIPNGGVGGGDGVEALRSLITKAVND